ncbi:SMC family ATPase [Mycetocola lacteus]|uniref:Nuclease SbcCD subunit C n=1 Tax=Mycetocola lacteus TaxID=76637 RepID=A0A3L7AQX9_9MICO|nr:AAA family ATPase [Mycetocola lacteus]RLP82866.1 SMC family ATPase [Mycetocola lacteus]
MRIHRLSIAGFGPFLDTQEVDFDAFAAEGLFLIAGKTGAGKSSILDAICFALYDGAPRYDGTPGRLRSDHCGPGDPTLVELEFSTGGERYRVRRSPGYERPKSRGAGTTMQKPTAELAILRPDGWEVLFAQPREVGKELAEIVKLRREQFLQVILLAQNRFGEFLRAQSSERLELLRTLFGTARFEHYERDIFERMREAEGELSSRKSAAEALAVRVGEVLPAQSSADDSGEGSADNLGDASVQGSALGPGQPADSFTLPPMPAVPDADWFARAREVSAAEVARTESALGVADARQQEAREALREREALADRQRRLTAARAEFAALGERSAEIDGDRVTLEAADRAAQVEPLVQRLEAARDARAAIEDTHTALIRAAEAAKPVDTTAEDTDTAQTESADLSLVADPATPEDALTAIAERRTRHLGRLEAEAKAGRELPTLNARVATRTKEEEAAASALIRAQERGAALPADLARARETRNETAARAARLDSLLGETQSLSARAEALSALIALGPRLSSAREVAAQAETSQQAAAAHQRAVLRRRLAGFAGELAAELESGEPCAVCGSTTHPHPAEVSADAVGEEDVTAAEARVAEAARALAAATSTLGELAQNRSALSARAFGSADVPEDLEAARHALVADLAEATRIRSEAEQAARDLPARETEIEALEAEQNRADAVIAEGRDALAAAASARVSAHQAAEDLSRRLALAHVGYPDLPAAIEAVTRARDLARDRARIMGDRVRLQAAVETAREERDLALAANGFAREEDWAAARRADREQIRARVSAHDTALAAVSGRIESPDLVDLPAEPVDPGEAREAEHRAGLDRDTAASAHHDQRSRHRDLDTLLTSLADAQADIAEELTTFERLRALATVLRGGENNARRMRLESFVLAAELEEIVRAANLRLAEMSGGRFHLEHDDTVQHGRGQSGLGLNIFDGFTGVARATQSLSGGESFLASLALALGLAEVVTQRAGDITLDTLFIDEGFGSLDAETLDTAMATLDGLRAGGRTVGVISHVPAMQERIPARLTVHASGAGPSRIEYAEG